MACILHIETSTDVCSVAVSQDGGIIYHNEDFTGPNHAVVLGGYVQDALSFIDSHAIPLDAVAVSSGPGSYTGLRIGVSMAKGISFGRSVPLIAVPTLALLCVPLLLSEKIPEGALLCPMLDARRMEVYSSIYDRGLRVVRDIEAEIIDENSFHSQLEQSEIYFFGNGSEKCKGVLTHKNAHFISDVFPLAKNMMPLAEKRFLNEEFEDVAYFEPSYLKEFIAVKSKKLL